MASLLEGRIAIVTGGGWNIGRAVALRFAREGARVAVCGRREDLLRETVALIEGEGGHAMAEAVDVTDLARVEAFAAHVREKFGPVDALAAIAGDSAAAGAIDEVDPLRWESVIRVNLLGTFHAVRAVLPGMRERGGGSILTCTGGGAFFPLLGAQATAYATAKAGLCRLTDQLAVELMPTGVRVNCIAPGLVWNDERRREIEEEERRTGQPHPERAEAHPPEDAAELATWLVSDASAPLSGRTVTVDDDWWRDPEQVNAVCGSMHAFTLRRVDSP